MDRAGLLEKMTFEQSHDRGERASHAQCGSQGLQSREWQVQTPGGRQSLGYGRAYRSVLRAFVGQWGGTGPVRDEVGEVGKSR